MLARMWASAGRLVTAWRKSLESDVRKMQDQSFQIQTLLCFQKPFHPVRRKVRKFFGAERWVPRGPHWSGDSVDCPSSILEIVGLSRNLGMAPHFMERLDSDRKEMGRGNFIWNDDEPVGLFQASKWSNNSMWAVWSAQVVVAVVPGGAGEAAFVQPGQAILDINGCQMMVRNSVGTTGNPGNFAEIWYTVHNFECWYFDMCQSSSKHRLIM